jgi:glycyl-tRNA synthetase
VLAAIVAAYDEEDLDGDCRLVMRFPAKVAPIQIAVFPLLKNKEDLVAKAREVFSALKSKYRVEFDDNGNIGKRYRRQDEIGTPYCVTVDFDSLENGDVTVRDRDSMKQERVSISELENYLEREMEK